MNNFEIWLKNTEDTFPVNVVLIAMILFANVA